MLIFPTLKELELTLVNIYFIFQECTNALELNPNYVKALLRRAQTYEDTDKPHEAMKDFEKVLEFDPGHKDARMAVMRLPEKIKTKDEKLKEEMMCKLKIS